MKRLRAWGFLSFGLVAACGSDPALESAPTDEAESYVLAELPVALAPHLDLSTSRIIVEEGELVVAREVAPPIATEARDEGTPAGDAVDDAMGDAIDDGASGERGLPSEDLRGRDQLRIGARAEDGVVMRLRNGSTLRIHEDGALGETRNVDGTASYAREGGRSYWTTGPEQGFEEWLEVAASDGRAPIARWRVDGHTFRILPETGGVHVLDARGHAVAYVTAPEAWTIDGTPVAPLLEVNDASLTLTVNTHGQRAFIDPRWVPTDSMAVARAPSETMNTVATIPAGILFVGGGVGAELYDPTTHVWRDGGAMVRNHGRGYFVAALRDGRVLVGGGTRSTAPSYPTTTELYEPTTNTWSATGSMASGRSMASATTLRDGRVLVVGGGLNSDPLSAVELYDPTTGTWSGAAPMPTATLWHAAVMLADDRVLVVGGSDNTRPLSSAYVYDPVMDRWTSVGPMRAARCRATATLLPDGRVLVAGGLTPAGRATSAEIFNPVTRTFTSTTSMTDPRDYHSSHIFDGEVWIIGAGLASTEIYSPTTSSWRVGPPLILGRRDHGAAVLPGSIVVAGGDDATSTPTASSEILLTSDVCGNGVLDAGEQCDDGNNVNNDCCSAICRIDAAGTPCGWTGEGCDAMEVCDGTTTVCPPDRLLASGVSCRGAVDVCDAVERCDGVTRACPTDARLAAGTVCRPSIGDCDLADVCDGSSVSCEGDRAMTRGTACGPTPADPCDLVDTCSGTTGATAVCTRNVAAVGTSCRPSRGPCDPAEVCDGTAVCPSDVTRADGASCGDGLGCNGVETCVAGLCVSDGPIDCSDDDVCTLRACVEPGMCTTRSVVGCCNGDIDCDDGNACTNDSCMVSGHACVNEPITCDDGDACTIDACAGDGSCTHEASSSCVDAATSDDGGIEVRDAGSRIDAATTPLDAGRTNDVGASDATLDGSSTVPADAGASTTVGSGCGCRVQRASPSRLSWLVVALALVMARNRRRSRR